MMDARMYSGACERNRDPILRALVRLFGRCTSVLEVSAGTGMHAVHFAPALPHLRWQPSDVSESALQSIRAWAVHQPAPNLNPPIRLDTTALPWTVSGVDGIFCANMIHITSWTVGLGLLEGAEQILPAEGRLVLYGPFKIGGTHTASSNAGFDQSLRASDPSWGVRDLDMVQSEAAARGLEFEERIQMPANNQLVSFVRRPSDN
jgi:hypothetical protein